MANRKKSILEIILLFPFSLLYRIVISIRNKLFDLNILQSTDFDIPIISVGNITVGGTGKTPHVEYLIRLLKNDFKLATLSRGYKRKTRNYVLSNKKSTVEEIGDEAYQIKKKFPEIEVAVEKRRVKGINNLLKDVENLDAILLDDAYQHRYVEPGISILLIDYNRPLSKDYLLPLGRLRESPHQKKRANIVIVTKCPQKLKPIDRRIRVKQLNVFPYQSLYFTRFKYSDPTPVFAEYKKTASFGTKTKPTVLVISGIANPHHFNNHIKKISPKIKQLTFPDHYNYTEKDIQKILNEFGHIANENKYILTTEKDAVRLQKFKSIPENIKIQMFYIPIEIEFFEGDEEKFNHQICNFVKYNKKDNILHRG